MGRSKGRDERDRERSPPFCFHLHVPLFSLSLENIFIPALLHSETKGLSQTLSAGGKGDKRDLTTPQRERFRNL